MRVLRPLSESRRVSTVQVPSRGPQTSRWERNVSVFSSIGTRSKITFNRQEDFDIDIAETTSSERIHVTNVSGGIFDSFPDNISCKTKITYSCLKVITQVTEERNDAKDNWKDLVDVPLLNSRDQNRCDSGKISRDPLNSSQAYLVFF